MITTKTLRLDVTKKYTEPIYLVQYEVNARILDIYLSAGSLPINLTGASVVFYAKKPDGTILFNNCTVVDAVSGHVVYTVTEQMCAVAGDLRCWILVIKDDAELRSIEFKVTVQPSEDDTEAIESTSEFTALEEALALVNDYLMSYETGTWTPVLYGTTTAGTPTYQIRGGRWERKGNLMHVWGVCVASALNDVAGNLRIGGLPAAAVMNSPGIVGFSRGASGIPITLHVDLGTTYIQLCKPSAYLSNTDVTSNFGLWSFALTYETP